jgi:hypothetical protein
MNKSELRIGNWVNYLNEPCKLNAGLWTHQPEILIKPIPLTAEILIKCGFRQILDNYLFEKVINETLTLNVYKEGISLHSKGCNFEITLPVFHLHRLQNLWFELTNTELEYK